MHPGRALWRAALVIAAAAAVWAGGLVWFATPYSADDRTAPSDAIVVLTGGSLRVESGIDLLREGKGKALFISGVDRRVDLGELRRIVGAVPDWAACCIALGHDADNTLGNARETARWMQHRGYRSLRLVTSWYHMPRSRLEFERAMPGLEIIPHPVFPDRVKERQWWAWSGTAALLVNEYDKYLAALFRPLVERDRPGEPEPVEAEIRR